MRHPRFIWIATTFLLINLGLRVNESILLKEYSGVFLTFASLITAFTIYSGRTEGFFPLKTYKHISTCLALLVIIAFGNFYNIYSERSEELRLLKEIKNRNDELSILL